MSTPAAALWVRLGREAERVRCALPPRTLEIEGSAEARAIDSMTDELVDAVLTIGALGGLSQGPDPEILARDLLGAIGDAELRFIDISRRSGSKGRLFDAALRGRSGGRQRAVDVPALLRRTGWIVLDLERTDLSGLGLPFPQLVVGRAVPRERPGIRPLPEA